MNGEIPADLTAIIAAQSQTVCEEGAALAVEKRSGRRIHFFLVNLASGVDLVPGLDRVTVARVEPYRRVHLMHSLFSVRVNIYLTRRRLFS